MRTSLSVEKIAKFDATVRTFSSEHNVYWEKHVKCRPLSLKSNLLWRR